MARPENLTVEMRPGAELAGSDARSGFAMAYAEGNRVPGDPLIILGNGPSLKNFDFARLRKFDCIGMNAAYRYWREIDWYPRYYICLDLVVGVSHKDAIVDMVRCSDKNEIELFFLRRNLIDVLPQDLCASPKIVDFDALHRDRLNNCAADLITTGSHAALVGAELGYRRLALLGIDCNYTERVDGARAADDFVLEIAETPNANPNYFFSGYQIAGDRYHKPNPAPDLHVRSWQAVAPFLKARGVEVWNCSSISQVDAFLFRDFGDIESEQLERGELLELTAEPRSTVYDFSTRLRQFAMWVQRSVWRWRWKLSTLAIIVIIFLVTQAIATLDDFYRWALLVTGLIFGLIVVGTLGLSFYQIARDARARAIIAFSKATLVARELKALEEKLESKDTANPDR